MKGDTRSLDYSSYGGFPKLGVPFWKVPAIRIIVFWGLYCGPPVLGNYNITFRVLGLEFWL